MRILNFGSLNIDNVYAVDHFIRPGETMSSLGMEVFCGGDFLLGFLQGSLEFTAFYF